MAGDEAWLAMVEALHGGETPEELLHALLHDGAVAESGDESSVSAEEPPIQKRMRAESKSTTGVASEECQGRTRWVALSKSGIEEGKRRQNPRDTSRHITVGVPSPTESSDVRGQEPPKRKKKKKRTPCRIRSDLEELRKNVRELEAYRDVLQERRRARHSVSTDEASQDLGLVVKKQQLWNSIAMRQYRWRRESEEENGRLKLAVQEQNKVVQSLEKLLRRSNSLLSNVTPITHYPVNMEDSRFARHVHGLMQVTNEMYSHAHQVLFTQPLVGVLGDSSGEDSQLMGEFECVRPLPASGAARISTAAMTQRRFVPCNTRSVSKAVWGYFTSSTGESETYFRERLNVSSDSVIKSFQLHWAGQGDHQGVLVARRFAQPDGVDILVYTAELVPLDSQTPTTTSSSSGFRTHGWTMVRPAGDAIAGSGASNSAEIRHKNVTTPIEPPSAHSPPRLSFCSRPELPTRCHLNNLVQFSLNRHHERVHRAIDDALLTSLKTPVIKTSDT